MPRPGSLPGRQHLRWLRSRVPHERLFAPRVALALVAESGQIVVDADGDLPWMDLELDASLSAAAGELVARLGEEGMGLEPWTVATGPDWWEDDAELGPVQPLWVVLAGGLANRAASSPTRPRSQVLLLEQGVDGRAGVRPVVADADQAVAGGDYVRAVRAHVAHERIFYPWSGLAMRDEEGRLFLVRLRSGRQWHCPGGGMEIGETAAATAARELLEETGLVAEPGQLIGCFSRLQRTFPNGDQIQAVAILQSGRLTGGALRPDSTDEIDQAGWFEAGSLPPLVPPWSERVRLVLEGIGPRFD